MSILSSNRLDENQISHSISHFLSKFQVIRLFRACGGDKAKGISVECLFAYILSNVFHASSFYMQQRDSKWQKRFSKNTYYRFLNNPHVNWLHFTTRLAARIIQRFLIPRLLRIGRPASSLMIPSMNVQDTNVRNWQPASLTTFLCATRKNFAY